MEKPIILLLDFDPASELGEGTQRILSSSDLEVEFQREVVSQDTADCDLFNLISHVAPEVVVFILPQRPLKQFSAVSQWLNNELGAQSVIIAVEGVQPNEMFEWLKLGVTDFVIPPLRPNDIIPRIRRIFDRTTQQDSLAQELKGKLGLKQLVGKSPAFENEVGKIPRIAKCSANVLISGETGTGKELCARAIHYLSRRPGGPFVPVGCGTIPIDLVENELFGHERGAFTGADRLHPGLVHEARGGTLFLDEIDCIPATVQVKLLRFLQDGEYRRLGSTRIRRSDLRIIAATNVDLEEAVSGGRLRQDLYYRLNIISIELPPLRERYGDVPLLVHHFLKKFAAEFDKEVSEFSTEAMQLLVRYNWPGNVRELEHVIERIVAFTEEQVIGKDELISQHAQFATCRGSFQEAKSSVIARFEKNYIRELLTSHQGNISRAAQTACKNRRAFWQLIRKHQIDVQAFRPRP